MDLDEYLVREEEPEHAAEIDIDRMPGAAFSDFSVTTGKGKRKVVKHTRTWTQAIRLTLTAEDGTRLCWDFPNQVFKEWAAMAAQVTCDG